MSARTKILEFQKYCKKIGIEEEDNKIDELLKIASSICPEEIEQIFISTCAVKGNTEFGDLWFFSKGYTVYIDEPSIKSTKPILFLIPLDIKWLKISDTSYDFANVKETSTLNAEVKFRGRPFGEQSTITLHAYSQNCLDLGNLITQYLKPKIRT